jgi:hypothetical protein
MTGRGTQTIGRLATALFWVTLVFQTTQLKYIWGIEGLSRVANLAALLVMTVAALYTLVFERFGRAVWSLYIVPGLLVFAGMAVNITRNAIPDSSVISYYGMMLPWAAYLTAPLLVNLGAIDVPRIWKQYYWFMVAAVTLGLSDYVSVFYGGTILKPVETPEGVYLTGRFSLLYGLDDGTAHTRFYACFPEPGTLAMFLLPAIAYAFLNRRIAGLIMLLFGFALTQSLGGVIGLIMLVACLAFVRARNSRFVIPGLAFAGALSLVLWLSAGDQIIEAYKERGDSRSIREAAFRNTVTNLPTLVLDYPLGFPVGNQVTDEERRLNLGGNFTFGNALQLGGTAAFLGYLVAVVIAVFCAGFALASQKLERHETVVFCSLLVLFPFVVQRTVIWDSALFAFMFAPSVIGFLRRQAPVVSAPLMQPT